MKMPETKFAQSGGISIAYQVVGEGPINVVFVPGYMSHVELNWEYTFYAVVLKELSSYARLVVLDKRGTGLSDRTNGLGTFEERMDDVRAVMDAAGVQRAALVGISEGAAMCTLMAAMHPDRVTKLVLLAAACPGVFSYTEQERESYLKFVREAWYTGKVLSSFIQRAPDPARWHLRSWRASSATAASRQWRGRSWPETSTAISARPCRQWPCLRWCCTIAMTHWFR
jgi:pimeloyl-ACP methyl ester carboxylesterase